MPEAARTQCSEPQPHRISRVFSCISGWGRPPRCRRISYKRTSRIISNRRAGVAKRFFVKRNGAELGGVQSFQAFQGLIKKPGGGNSNILLCSPGTLGTWSNLTSIFQMGLVQPPTRKICWPLGKPKGSLHRFHSPVSEWLTWLGRQKKKVMRGQIHTTGPPNRFLYKQRTLERKLHYVFVEELLDGEIMSHSLGSFKQIYIHRTYMYIMILYYIFMIHLFSKNLPWSGLVLFGVICSLLQPMPCPTGLGHRCGVQRAYWERTLAGVQHSASGQSCQKMTPKWLPSRELTYPLPRHCWRWFSFSQGGIC